MNADSGWGCAASFPRLGRAKKYGALASRTGQGQLNWPVELDLEELFSHLWAKGNEIPGLGAGTA